jgi:hypothetical protein
MSAYIVTCISSRSDVLINIFIYVQMHKNMFDIDSQSHVLYVPVYIFSMYFFFNDNKSVHRIPEYSIMAG